MIIMINVDQKKKWIASEIEYLESPLDADFNDDWQPYIKSFTEFRRKLIKDQDRSKTIEGKKELNLSLDSKSYKNFLDDLKFERGRITYDNYASNFGNLNSSYRTYLRNR